MLTYKIFLNTDMTIKDVISSGNLVQYSWNNISLNVYIPKAIYETTPSISNTVSITFAQTKENGETVITNNARLYEFSYVKDNVIVGNIEYVLLTRQMPQQMTLYFGNTQKFQINHLVISDNEIISFAQSPFYTYEVFQASNTQEIHDEPSTVDELQAEINRAKEDIESLKTNKQDKASTNIHVRTTSAVDEDRNHFTTSVESGLNVLSTRTDDLEIDNKKNKEDIEELKSAIINNFTPLGKMTGNTAEPTLEQINAWLVEQGITNVELGDLIIYVGQVPDVNTNYKCIYSVDGWFWYETTELETASNSNMGVVKGNGNDTHANEAIDIQNGEIQGIKVKDMNGTQRYLKGYINDLEDKQAKILDGTTAVPMANKSKNDEAGNDIQATYQTKTLGATKQYVKDYALSKAFNDMNYINFSADSNTIEPTYHGGTKNLTISNIGDVKLFSATYHNDVYEYSLSQNNVFELHLPIMLNVAKTTKLKAVIKLDNGTDTPTTIGTADSSNIEFVADSFTLVTINGAFTSLQEPIKITPTSSLIVDVYIFNDETTTFRVNIANALYQPSSFTLTIPYQTIQIVQGGAVGQQYVHTICTYNETAQADLGVGYVFDLSGIDLVEGTEHKFIANVPLRETYIRIAKDDTEIDFVDGNGAQPQYSNTNHLLVYPVNTTTMKIIFSAYYTNAHFVLIEPNLEQYAKLNDLTTLATKTELTNLSNDVDSRLDQQDAVIQGLGNLEPSGVDTSTNILAFTTNKGIYVGSDTGHWYYWNGTQYVDGGVYQATEIPDNSVTLDKLATDVKNELPTISVNLYNYNTANIVGYYRNGGLNSNANYRTSDFIAVTPNETIYTNCFGYYNFWTKDKQSIHADVINTANTNLSFTVPANAYYMTVGTTQDNMDHCMVNRGTDYIPHRHYVRLLPPYVASFDFNNYTLPYIKDMKVCCNKTSGTTTAYYAGVEVDEAPTKMTIRWVFEKGTKGGTVALISNPNGLAKVSDITQNSLHLTISDNGIRLTCLGQKYGQYYYCDIINVTFTDKLLTDGVTENTAEMEILANANVVRLKVNGVNYSGSFTDTLSKGVTLNDFVGKYCTFEHYCYGDRDTFAMPQFTYFEVLTPNMKVMDNFKRENSQLTTTPTGQIYHLMTDRFHA